jgi:hypothetical protein
MHAGRGRPQQELNHMRTVIVITLSLAALLAGCNRVDRTTTPQFYKLNPRPTPAQVAAFQRLFPDTPVTTTQPGTYDKIEIGMTRAMVRALVGERLTTDSRLTPHIVQEDCSATIDTHVQLYFEPDETDPDQDVLYFIKVRTKGYCPPDSTASP